VHPIQNGKRFVKFEKITHMIFRIQLMLNPSKYTSHRILNDDLTCLGKTIAGYHGTFPKNELLSLQDSIFNAAKAVGKEVWDEIQTVTNPSKTN
jgi:hypothetical protein